MQTRDKIIGMVFKKDELCVKLPQADVGNRFYFKTPRKPGCVVAS